MPDQPHPEATTGAGPTSTGIEAGHPAPGTRLPNLHKLQHVPVFALRELLETRGASLQTGHLSQAELVAKADELLAITGTDVEALYENYRYGQQLSFYLFLLPENLALPDTDQIQNTLDELSVPGQSTLAEMVHAGRDYETETPPRQIALLDREQFDSICEVRFRYYVAHRFLNAEEDQDEVLQTRYGFLWLDLQLGYLVILSRDELVNSLLTQALGTCLKAIPLQVRFPKELVDKHFSIEKVKRVSHYDPGTGVRQSISGRDLWQSHEQELLNREQSYARPSSLYEEELANGMTSGLGVTSSKGQIYFTKKLPTSLVRAWGIQRLPDLVRDVKALRASQPGSIYRSVDAIQRMRMRAEGKEAIMSVVEALLQTEREELTSVAMPQSALAIYEALAGKYFSPYLRVQCGQCDETADLCSQCESEKLDLKGRQVRCRNCGTSLADDQSVVLRCLNGHVTTVPREEVWSIAPNHWLQKRMASIFAEIGRPWSEKDDYFYIEGSTLYRLRRNRVYRAPLPSVVQNYINNFWEPVQGQVHAGAGDLLVNSPEPRDSAETGTSEHESWDEESSTGHRGYLNLDLRLRGDMATGYMVEADVQNGGSVSPQPLVFPPSREFQRRLQAIQRQSTTAEDMRAAGETLFDALFPTRILKLWLRTMGSLEEGVGLRIRLHIEPLELMTLPWELLFEEEYLGLRVRFPIVRYLDLPHAPRPLAVRPPLRVLVAVSQPRDLKPFDVDDELAHIQVALARLPDKIAVDVLRKARRDELLARLREGYHVLHFVGHGAFERNDGYLMLEDAEERADPVPALLLGQMVADSDLRLAVLNACGTSSQGFEIAMGGVAQQLVKGGIPAVVAMQQSVPDQSAGAFSREFYGALASGWPVDAAVQEGRRGVMTELGSNWAKFVDWAIPTLYMRSPDGRILEVQGSRARAS
jgi:hypothetical protein